MGSGNSRKVGIFVDALQKAAMVAANSPSGANPFATIADIGNGIYDGSGSIPDGTISTMAGGITFAATVGSGGQRSFWVEVDGTSPHQKTFVVAPNGYTGALASATIVAADTSGTKIVGFNSSDNNFALRLFNGGESIRIAAFENNGDVVMGEDTNPSRARVSIGTTASFSNAKLTVRGVDASSARVAFYAGGTGATGSLQVNNNNHVGIGAVSSDAKLNIRGNGVGTGYALVIENSLGQDQFRFQDNSLQLNGIGAVPTGVWGTAYSFMGDSNVTANTGDHAGAVVRLDQRPTANGNADGAAIWGITQKATAFTTGITTGVHGLAQVTSAAQATRVRGGYFEGRNDNVASTTFDLFGAQFATVCLGGDHRNFGGIVIKHSTRNNGTVDNHIDIFVDNPSGSQTGTSPVNNYVLLARDKGFTASSGNWGLYVEGAGRTQYFEGAMSIGSVDTPDASAILQLDSTSKGFAPPNMTTVQRDAIVLPKKSLVIYNTTTDQWEGNNGTPGAPNWVLIG